MYVCQQNMTLLKLCPYICLLPSFPHPKEKSAMNLALQENRCTIFSMNENVSTAAQGEASGVQEIHVQADLLLATEREVKGHPTEKLFELSGNVRGNAAYVAGLHPITVGVRSERNSVQVTDVDAANASLNQQRAGRTDAHIGTAHSHLPEHMQGPSSQDMANIRRHRGKAHRQVYLLFQDRGNGIVGFQGRNTEGKRVRVAVHDRQGRVFWDAPDSPHWRLESNGDVTQRQTAA
jgi:hypothetical protein